MTTDRNERQARKLLALGLDEFGHHTEAANVRAGIDLDDYRVDLWAIRAALDSQPAAAPGIDLSEVPRYTLAHGDFTSEMLEHSQGAWVRLGDVESALIDASPKGTTLNEQFGSAEGLGSAAHYRQVLERIATQGPHYGPDGTRETWKHWSYIARDALADSPKGGSEAGEHWQDRMADIEGRPRPEPEPDEVEEVISCLGDDAAAMLDENPEDERALNMQRAAELLAELQAQASDAEVRP